jgi:sugar-specific transcriptional regulator TrmB
MEIIIEKLNRAGLTGNESKVYLELLKRGSTSANKLAKNTVLDRTLAYQILNNLIEKGLASYIIKEKRSILKQQLRKIYLDLLKRKNN